MLGGLLLAGTVRATAPAVPPSVLRNDSPTTALLQMIRAAQAGDQAALLDCFVFKDAASQNAASVLLGQVISEEHFYAALVKAFPGAATPENNALEALTRALSTARVTVTGQEAQVTTAPGQTYYMLPRNGKWKIDFDRTQAGMGALPDSEKLAQIRQQTFALDQLTDDVKNKRVQSADAAIAGLVAIAQQVPDPIMGPPPGTKTQTPGAAATRPATRP